MGFSTRYGDTNLVGYSDNSHATARADRKSTTGMVFNYGGRTTNVQRKQSTVALSSCEVEFMAATALVDN